jgi:cobalamin biosynthesis Co2+ chelatase CbiK
MSPQEHPAPAIALVAYGSLNSQAIATYSKIREHYEMEFPGAEVRLAFTSGYIRLGYWKEDGNSIPNPFTVLAELQDMDTRNSGPVTANSSGEDFHQVALLVQGLSALPESSASGALVGKPLLANLKTA